MINNQLVIQKNNTKGYNRGVRDPPLQCVITIIQFSKTKIPSQKHYMFGRSIVNLLFNAIHYIFSI